MGYRELRRALLEKLGITPQALSQRVTRKKASLPMSTQDATCVIAHEQGLPIDRFLPEEDLTRVRSLVAMSASTSESVPAKRSAAKKSANRPIEIRFPKEFRLKDPVLSKQKIEEARQMAEVYPLLYVLENSIREVIRRVMSGKYGEDWWGTEFTRGKVKGVRDKANTRRDQELTKQSWHQRRGDHPIDYVDLRDLLTIINARQSDFFPDVITDRDWFTQFMRELEPSRNVLCHMNPLDDLNVKDVRQKLERWNRMITERQANIP